MKKRLLALFLALALCLTACAAAGDPPPPEDDTEETPPAPEAVLPADSIQALTFLSQLPRPSGVEGLEPYGNYWNDARISADLSDSPLLAYSLTISDATQFPEEDKLPEGYDPCALIAWGMDPGLNVDILHEHGFTGKGAIIAYVDQTLYPHEQYSGENFHVSNQDEYNSMHAPAVLSLLAGKDTGVAPEAEVYYYGFSANDAAQLNEANALYQIIEQNENLPEGEKITMVGFSDNIDPSENYEQEFRDAAAACEEAGIMVWFCGEYGAASFLPYCDKNDCRNLVMAQWIDPSYAGDAVFIPSSGRTTAATMGGATYTYWSSGGLSWTMPYALGLYAIAIEIDPTLTQGELRALLKETAYHVREMNLVNPVGFVSAVLRRVGRDEEADAMLKEAEERVSNGFTYAVWEKSTQTALDYLTALTDTTVLAVKADAVSSGAELEAVIRADAAQRGGFVKELILFGDEAVTLAPEGEAGFPVTLFPDLEAIPQLPAIFPSDAYAERTVAIRRLAEEAAARFVIIDGTPDETPQEIPVVLDFEISEVREGWEIHSFNVQELEDGMLRFTLEYTAPEGWEHGVFNPPSGDLISMVDWPVTSGERESIEFELSVEDLRLTGGVTLSFWSYEWNSTVFVLPDWSYVKLPD